MKMLCALLYLITGILSAITLSEATGYSVMVLSALASGFFGDFFLSYKNDRHFFVGVVFFAFGHLIYSLTFLCVGPNRASTSLPLVAIITTVITAAALIFAKLKLTLKGKKRLLLVYAPILIFAFVCSVVCAGVAIANGNLPFGLCLAVGGTLFFASDIMIGVDKGGIKRPEFLHNAVSYTYFTAQALFALSIYFQ